MNPNKLFSLIAHHIADSTETDRSNYDPTIVRKFATLMGDFSEANAKALADLLSPGVVKDMIEEEIERLFPKKKQVKKDE